MVITHTWRAYKCERFAYRPHYGPIITGPATYTDIRRDATGRILLRLRSIGRVAYTSPARLATQDEINAAMHA